MRTPSRVERVDCLRRGRLDRIGDRDETNRPSADGDEHDRLPLATMCFRGGVETGRLDVMLAEQRDVAEQDLCTSNVTGDALASERLEARYRRDFGLLLVRRGDDRGRQRMLTPPLQASGQPEHLVFLEPFDPANFDDAGAPFGQRPGLVDHESVDGFHAFEGLGVLDQHSRRGATTGADHDRHRRCEAERARACDDQDRDGADQRMSEARLGSRERPRDEGEHGDSDHCRNEPLGNAIRELLDRRPAALRVTDHPDDLGQQRVGADALGTHDEAAGAVDRSPGEGGAGRLLDRHRFPCHHRLVNGALSFHDDAVDRNLLAGPHAKAIAHPDPIERHILFVAGDAPRRLRCQSKQRLDRGAGPASRAQFQDLPQKNEHDDHRGRVEVGFDHAMHPETCGEPLGGERGRSRVAIRGADAEGDQREHVGAAIDDRIPATLKERPTGPEDDRRCERGGDPVRDPQIEPAAESWTEQHVAHGEHENWSGERGRNPKPPRHVHQLGVWPVVEGRDAGLERHAADRA